MPAFLAKRCLRIFPALAVVVTLTTYLLGPAMTTLSIHDYFQSWIPQHYMKGIVLYVSYYLPGVFEDNTYRIAVNGSLWSLPAEFLCYLIVAATAVLPKQFGGICLTIGLLVTASLNLYSPYYKGPQIIYYATDLFQWAAVGVCFFVGALYCAFRVPLHPLVGLAALGGLLITAEFLPLTAWSVFMWIGLPYLILSPGSYSVPILSKWGRFGDLSYGMYLYSFPITQAIIALNHNKIDVHILILCVTLLSGGCAFLSWHLVEKRVLRFKPLSQNGRQWQSLSNGAPVNPVAGGARW